MLPSKSLCYLVIMGNAVMLVSYSIQGEDALVFGAEALLPRQRSSSPPYQRASIIVAPIGEEVLTPLATEVAIAIVIQAVTPPTLEVSGAAALGVVTSPTTLDVSTVASEEVFSECPLDKGPPIAWKTEDVAAMKDVSILPTAVAPPVTVVSSIEVITKVRILYRQTSLASSVDATLVESEHCE